MKLSTNGQYNRTVNFTVYNLIRGNLFLKVILYVIFSYINYLLYEKKTITIAIETGREYG